MPGARNRLPLPHARAHRGERNEPAYVRHVCEKIAELHGTDAATVAAVTTANARRMFGKGEGATTRNDK